MTDLSERAPDIIARYPEGRSRSAILPLLHLAQERDGYLTKEGMAEVGGILGLSAAEVYSVASFYTMFHLKPKGRRLISVCHNIACSLAGAERLIAALEDHLGIGCGETTEDGAFTLERAECLAACEMAPMLQIDHQMMVGPLDAEQAVSLVEGLPDGDVEAGILEEAVPSTDVAARASEAEGVDEGAGAEFFAGRPQVAAAQDASPGPPEAETAEARGSQVSPEPPIRVVGEQEIKTDEVEPRIPGSQPQPLIDSIPLTDEERLWLEPTERRGGSRPPPPGRRLREIPVEGVGPGPHSDEGDEDGPGRPDGADHDDDEKENR